MQQNSVLIVVAFPGHEADQSVLAQEISPSFGGSLSAENVVPFLTTIAHINGGALVDAGSLVGAHKLNQFIGIGGAIFQTDNDLIRVNAFNGAVMGSQHADTGVK